MYLGENAANRYELAEVFDLTCQLCALSEDLTQWTPEVLLPRRRELQVAVALLDRAVRCTEQMLLPPEADS